MFHEFAGEFYDVGVASGQRKTLGGPEFAADQGEGDESQLELPANCLTGNVTRVRPLPHE